MATITRDTIAEQLAEHAEITMVAAREEVRWFFDQLTSGLTSGDEIRIHGFGTFKTAERAARTGRNPRTGEAVKVAARRVVKFSASSTLSEQLKSAKRAPSRARAKR